MMWLSWFSPKTNAKHAPWWEGGRRTYFVTPDLSYDWGWNWGRRTNKTIGMGIYIPVYLAYDHNTTYTACG